MSKVNTESLHEETEMGSGFNLKRLLTDESGGEVLEYALIAGLIVVASIAMIAKVGVKVLARWGSLDSSM
jgi:Flp pilus assembly pilin Flp